MTAMSLPESAGVADFRWRAAVIDVYEAQRRYLDLLEAEEANERELELAWLTLWRAEQRRDSILFQSG